MDTIYFEITNGDIKVGVSVTENADGTLTFDLNVLDDTGVIGDLNGLFFDLADDSLAENLKVSGTDLTGENIEANSVTKVDGYNNVNGEVVKEDGKFDIGVQFGTQGIGEDDIQATSFTLSTLDGSALSLEDILGQDFAVRLTSVGEIDGDRTDSVKISGSSPEEPEGPTSTTIAGDNSMTVSSNETFSLFGLPDIMDGTSAEDAFDFDFSLLENDTTDGAAYTGEVLAVNGQALVPGMVFEGSNGGLLTVNAMGEVDFSANGQFDYLTGDQTAQTQFTYEIEGGATAVLDVIITAFDPNGGGGGEDDLFL